MSANAREPVFWSRPNLEVVSTASPCIASVLRVWTDGGVFGSVKESKRGKKACSFSMEIDSLGIVSHESTSRGRNTYKISRSGGDAGQEVSTVTLTGGDSAAAPARYTGTVCRRTRRSLMLHPVMRSWEGQSASQR